MTETDPDLDESMDVEAEVEESETLQEAQGPEPGVMEDDSLVCPPETIVI